MLCTLKVRLEMF